MDLTYVIDGNLKPELCKDIIEKFEKDKRQSPGYTGGGLNTEMKTSLDLMFSRFADWEDVVKILDEKMKENLQKYQEFLQERLPNNYNVLDTWHSGYQLQKSGHYRWHHDSRIEHGRERIVTFIWYLNTIEEGGHTGFLYKSVKPETGKFVFFPSTWDYVHCGFPSKDKYIITGWLWRDYPIF
jgi:hypothetical protein